MKVAIIGAGHIASIHGPILLDMPDIDIVGIADRDVARSKICSSQLKDCPCYQDAEVMLDEQKPEVVHVLTPPQLHYPYSVMAMNKGCHVLVEKPMALNLDDAKTMVDIARQNGVSLCVNHNMVYESVVQKAKSIVEAGVIGKIVTVEASYQFDPRRYPAILDEGAQYGHWTYQMNGGPLQDLIPHPASLVFEFLNEIKDLHFITKNRGILPGGYPDDVKVLVHSQDVVGYISVSLSEKPDLILLTIKGTKGSIQANLYNDTLICQKKSALPRAVERGLSSFKIGSQNFKGFVSNVYKFMTKRIDKSNGVAPLIAQYYASFKNGSGPPVSIDKSLLVVEMTERIWPHPVVKRVAAKTPPAIKSKDSPTALVTGASGFIGTHLIKKLLSENQTVRALVRPNSAHAWRLKDLAVDIVEGDLSDEDVLFNATKGIKTIYHAGSPMGNNRIEYQAIAVEGTKKLVHAALKHRVARFVQFSSLTVYELLENKAKKIHEESPYQRKPEVMSPYAWAKIEIEKFVLDMFQKEGLPVTIVRPGIVIGPFCKVFFPHLGYNFQEKVFIVIGKGNNVLPLTFVENTVDAVYKAATSEKALGKAYNIVDDGEITVLDYIQRYAGFAGDPCKIIRLPYLVPYNATLAYEIAAGLGLIGKGKTSRAQLRWKQKKVFFSNQKAKDELAWLPQVPLEKALDRTFEWYGRLNAIN